MSANAVYCYLGDEAQPSWAVPEHRRDEAEVWIAFSFNRPAFAEVKALRKVSADVKNLSAADVFKQLRGLLHLVVMRVASLGNYNWIASRWG